MKVNNQIENILFDLGGVLYNIDYQLTYHEMAGLLQVNDADFTTIPELKEIERSYNSGTMRTETFLWRLQQLSTGPMPLPQQLIRAWNAMLLGWHEGIFDFLRELSDSYNLYLFSNINDLHFKYLQKELDQLGKDDFFFTLFHGTAFSHIVKYVKPDVSSFKNIIESFGIEAGKTLFIDDIVINVEGAREAGLHTCHHDRAKSIQQELFSYIELVC